MFEKQNLRNPLPGWTAIIFAGTMLALICTPLGAASAYALHRPHSFCAENNCDDGSFPSGNVIADANGDIYGVTTVGGLYNGGAVYELVPNTQRTKWAYHRLHSFCKDGVSCKDGTDPSGGLVIDADGNLYGTANYGSSAGWGVIYELSQSGNGWTYKTLHKFARDARGGGPRTGLAYYGQQSGSPWDGFLPLYGTTDVGGKYDLGVVYVLNHDGDTWNYSVIHTFSSGRGPQSLLVDSSSNLFGETQGGGKYNAGTLYKLKAGSWTETTLHNFCSSANCADGNDPYSNLVLDAAGNLYGVTAYGGSNCPSNETPGCGVAFERTAGGTFSVLYNFCSDTTACHDGNSPTSLMMDASGNFFGTTESGGFGNNGGIVFQLFPGTVSVLYSFCSQANCADGVRPRNPLLEDGTGDLFGVTTEGGAHDPNGGEVFELEP